MAREKDKPAVEAGVQGKIVDGDPRDVTVDGADATGEKKTNDAKLVAWVLDRTRRWKEHRNANYSQLWDMYERLWRAIYSSEEKTRKSERSKIISPALSEAVENAASEIEEAVFGRGDFFNATASGNDSEIEAAILTKNEATFKEDLAASDFTGNCSEAVINAAVYGTGIAEIAMSEIMERDVKIGVDPLSGKPGLQAVERTSERPALRSVNPRNFMIDPAARGIEDALGVAIEEDVGAHIVRAGIQAGDYKKVPIEAAAGDTETKPDPQMETPWMFDVVPVLRYYGKVPKHLLFPKEDTENLFPDDPAKSDEPVDTEMVEAWVVIANEQHLLKAIETPDVMKDRPVVAYQWDIVPGRFWGRGICEKGATPQKLLDAELRSRMDALAFVAAPMMAIDATRLPRGFKMDIYPGKSLLLSGDPNTILKPFKFGELDQNSTGQIQLLDQMVQRATGSIDATAMAKAGVGGDARSGAVSMALAPIVKRNKRTLMRYIDKFLAPALRKLLWRSMQYDTERYTPVNMTFNVSSTMGIMQREYESMSLVQMLSSLQAGSTEHLMILIGLVSNSGLQQRDQIKALLTEKLEILRQREAAPPVDPNAIPTDPVALQMQYLDAQLDIAVKQQKIAESQAKTRLLNAQAQSELAEPQIETQKLMMRGIYELPQDQIAKEFDRRMKMAELAITKQGIESRERIADKQIVAARANEPKAVEVEVPVEIETPVPVPVPVVIPTGANGLWSQP